MLARVFSCAVIGLDSVVVPEVEVDTGGGLPKMVIVGLPGMVLVETDFSGKVLEHVKRALLCARLCVDCRPVSGRIAGFCVPQEPLS